jgi:hypothetical protein
LRISDHNLTRADVAWLLGMSDSWVRDRMQADDLPRPGATAEKYVEAFVAFKVAKLTGDDEGGSYEVEKTRLTREQADEKAMDNAERRGELVSRPDITLAFASVIALAVSRLQLVPDIIAKGARAAYELWSREHPPAPPPPEPKVEMPPPLKWAAAIVSAVFAAAAVAMCIWVVSTLSDLQQTVTRIDERQLNTVNATGQRLDKIEERLIRLEQTKQEAGK